MINPAISLHGMRFRIARARNPHLHHIKGQAKRASSSIRMYEKEFASLRRTWRTAPTRIFAGTDCRRTPPATARVIACSSAGLWATFRAGERAVPSELMQAKNLDFRRCCAAKPSGAGSFICYE
jgi:hypothetical protein